MTEKNESSQPDEIETPSGSSETPNEPLVTEEDLLSLAQKEGLAEGWGVEAPEAESADAEDPLSPASPEQRAFLKAAIETILFMSDRPLGLPRLRAVIDDAVPLPTYRAMLAELREEFAADHRGLEIAEVSLGFQLRTKPHMAQVLRKLVKTTPLKLSPTNLEVLAVVAYKQPVTKDDLDQIRGVDSGYVLRNLMEKRLVRIAGRSDLPGRPMLYGTTHEFLELFSLKDAKSLPPLREVEQLVAQSEVGDEQAEQEALRDFGKMVEGSTRVLFEDGGIDAQVEELRAEIAAIPTSTAFIDEQKALERRAARLAELAEQGLTLDADDNIVPLGAPALHQPSEDLQRAAQLAGQERRFESLAKTIDESAPGVPPEPAPEPAEDSAPSPESAG